MSLFPAVMFDGRNEIGKDVWVDIMEDKNLTGFFFFLWNVLVVRRIRF